jgi:hypothetical protein
MHTRESHHQFPSKHSDAWRSQPRLIPAQKLGQTTIPLPLGGVASSDPAKVRAPLVHPFWLLAGMLAGVAACFLCLRLTLL